MLDEVKARCTECRSCRTTGSTSAVRSSAVSSRRQPRSPGAQPVSWPCSCRVTPRGSPTPITVRYLVQIAADTLGCDVSAVDLQIGDSALPDASVAGGSSGITSWGRAIVTAARQFRREHGDPPRSARRRWPRHPRTRSPNSSPCSPSAPTSSKRGSTGTPGNQSAADVGRLLHRPGDQRPYAALAAHRRNDDGTVDGVARGERARSAVRSRRHSGFRDVPHQLNMPTWPTSTRSGSTRCCPGCPDQRSSNSSR